MNYIFSLAVFLRAADEDDAKKSAEIILRALGVLAGDNMIRFDKIGISLLGPDGNDIPLLPPQFPEGETT